jgi:tRNA (uracil-5-)-methyltransferase
LSLRQPPRKGCDEGFLGQLVAVAPQTLVYVSCNVHTQARDVGFLLKQDVGGKRYVLESVRPSSHSPTHKLRADREARANLAISRYQLRGFDLFPQTAHVEGVAVLRLQ